MNENIFDKQKVLKDLDNDHNLYCDIANQLSGGKNILTENMVIHFSEEVIGALDVHLLEDKNSFIESLFNNYYDFYQSLGIIDKLEDALQECCNYTKPNSFYRY